MVKFLFHTVVMGVEGELWLFAPSRHLCLLSLLFFYQNQRLTLFSFTCWTCIVTLYCTFFVELR